MIGVYIRQYCIYLVSSKNNPRSEIPSADLSFSKFIICGIFCTKHINIVMILRKSANSCRYIFSTFDCSRFISPTQNSFQSSLFNCKYRRASRTSELWPDSYRQSKYIGQNNAYCRWTVIYSCYKYDTFEIDSHINVHAITVGIHVYTYKNVNASDATSKGTRVVIVGVLLES